VSQPSANRLIPAKQETIDSGTGPGFVFTLNQPEISMVGAIF
jgi:hypothetical protein